MMTVANYRQIFQGRAFRLFWLSFTLSALGDVMTRVALTWLVYDLTRSPEALGLLALTYTGPVVIGGLIAGPLLDRFDKRKVMIADNLIRGAALGLIPLLYGLGRLELWHIYAISTVYGGLMMISLAGSPALIPDLVAERELETANALETLSYTLSGVVGSPIAGLLIPFMGAANVVVLDVLSYFAFAWVLLRLPAPTQTATTPPDQPQSYSLADAVRLFLGNKVLLSTTLMFMAFNLGLGSLGVWLPILADQTLGGGAELFGLLLGALAVGEVLSSFLVGTIKLPIPLGAAIGLAQLCSGLTLLWLSLSPTVAVAIISLTLLGFCSAPLTIWAQTLRMKVIPAPLRGRAFALLRTLMQSATPVGGAVAGAAMPLWGLPVMIVTAAIWMGAPGLIGYGITALRQAD
jgi:MFS family permease